MDERKDITRGQTKNFGIVRASLWLGSAIIVVGCIFMIMENSLGNITGTVFTVGMACYIVSFFPYIGARQPFRDERALKIGMMSATMAWYLTIILTCALLGARVAFARYLSWEIGGFQLLGFVLIMLIVTMLVANEYYLRKGDAGLEA